LHTDGFIKIKVPDGLIDFDRVLTKLANYCLNHGAPIFNTKTSNEVGDDRKRVQIALREQDWFKHTKNKMPSDVAEIEPTINWVIGHYLPNLNPSTCHVIGSHKGAKSQQKHRDNKDDYTRDLADNDMSISALSYFESSFLYVWPKSCGSSFWKDENISYEPTCLRMDKGDILLFRQDLCHAGTESDSSNIRLHAYFDHPACKRDEDSTEYVRGKKYEGRILDVKVYRNNVCLCLGVCYGAASQLASV